MNMNVIDLFCGCGGLGLGFLNAGYKIILGIDNDESALKTFKANHDNTMILNLDLFESSAIRDIQKKLLKNEVDVITAGPPCQGFSLTGPRNFNDKRNTLYLAVIEAIKLFKPKAFLIENVPGLSTLYNGRVKAEIVKRLEDISYNVSTEILCAADYGVPQMRRRLFFVGIKKNFGVFKFPPPTRLFKKYVTCEDAISDLPSREKELGKEIDTYNGPPITEYQKEMRGDCQILYNHVATNHTDIVKNVISLVPEGGNYRNLPKGVGEHRKFNEAWTRYHSKKPSRTIDTGHRNHFHYKFNRVPTVRENARLQSFPDSFVFIGTRTQQYKQVGNAVPPLLAYHLGIQIKKYIIKGY